MIHLMVVRPYTKIMIFRFLFLLTKIFIEYLSKKYVSELESLPAAAEVSATRSDVNTV